MTTFIVRRLMEAVITVLLITIVVFLMMRLLPGDPIMMLVASGETAELSTEQVESLKHELGMDRPLLVQYTDWLGKAARGDLGSSIFGRYEVAGEVIRRLPVTLHLGMSAFLIGILVGPALGIVSAVRRGKLIDTLVTLVANVGITAPQFWIGILLIYFFGLYLGILPVYGYTSPFVDPWLSFRQSIMPIFCLAVFPVASAARQTRGMVIEVMQQDYIRTAWAKGLSERMIVTKHVLKNALMPVVTLQGLLFRNIIGGSVVIETIFFVPGIGRLMVDSLLAHDYPVIQGILLIVAVAVVLVNLFVDIIYTRLDPRIQYG